jgi:bacteriocin-like protein
VSWLLDTAFQRWGWSPLQNPTQEEIMTDNADNAKLEHCRPLTDEELSHVSGGLPILNAIKENAEQLRALEIFRDALIKASQI